MEGTTGGVFPAPGDQQAFIEQRFPGQPVPYNTKQGKITKGKAVKSEMSAADWLSQIVMCERAYQDTMIQAKRNLKLYENKRSGDRITVPLLTPLIEVKSALSTFRDPYISVRPRRKAVATTPEEVMAAAVKETYINWLWRYLDLKREVRRIVRDCLLLTGRGIGMPGYNMIVDPQQIISHDCVIMYRTSPFDYYLDIEADSSSNAFYGVRSMIMPIWFAEKQFGHPGVFAEIRYSRWARFKPMEQKLEWNTMRKFARTLVYEVQDLTTNSFYYLTPTYSNFLEKFENPYPIDGLLPEFMEPIPIPDEIFCVSEASLIRPQLEELTEVRNFWMELWKREIPKYLMDEGAGNADAIEKLISSNIASVTKVTDSAGIRLLEMPRSAPDLQYYEQHIKGDISEITGWNQFMQGAGTAQSSRKTAYEVKETVAGGNVRIADLNDHVEQFCSRIARKMLLIAAEFVGKQEMQQIVGLPADFREIGFPQGFEITEEVMKSDTEVTVFAGSMQLPSKEQDLQKAMMLQTLLAYPETNRFAVLSEMAQLLDLNPNQMFKSPEQVNSDQQQMQMMAAMGAGKGKELGGAQTGGIMGSRQRGDIAIPGIVG